MSMEFVGATLAGCKPCRGFQEEIKELHLVVENSGYGNTLFPGFQSLHLPSFWMHGEDNDDYAPCIKTDDGKAWFCARMFVAKNGGFVLLFPWQGDRARVDGSEADRLIQLHRFGYVELEDIKRVLKEFTEWAKQQNFVHPRM